MFIAGFCRLYIRSVYHPSKMAVVQTAALAVLLFISIYNVKRCAFICSDVVGLCGRF